MSGSNHACPKSGNSLPEPVLTLLLAGFSADCECKARLVAESRQSWGLPGSGFLIRLRGFPPPGLSPSRKAALGA